MEQIDLKKIYEKLTSMEKKILNIELVVNPDAFADEEDREAIERAEEEGRDGKMISIEELKRKRK